MGMPRFALAAACLGLLMAAPVAAEEPVSPKAVIATHIKLAEAMYGDALARRQTDHVHQSDRRSGPVRLSERFSSKTS